MIQPCPVCGKPGHACAGTASFDPSKVFDLTMKPVTGGALMPSKAIAGTGEKARYPQQHVRPGRGTAGYKGNVEVYETPVPKSFQEDGGTDTLAENEKKGTKAKQAPEGDK